ncbi:MAG: gamma-carbonic anhydrase [Verrucomicrobiota bacterium]
MNVGPDSLPVGHAGIDARLKKGPTIHPTAWIVPNATVVGDVTLEEESSVWYGAVLRGDINRIVIGPRSNVQDNAVIHLDTGFPTIIGELVTIGHSAIVHACKIDNEALIGMGAIVLDGAEVGARSIIGATRARHARDENSTRLARPRFPGQNPAAAHARRTKRSHAMDLELRRNRQAFRRALFDVER